MSIYQHTVEQVSNLERLKARKARQKPLKESPNGALKRMLNIIRDIDYNYACIGDVFNYHRWFQQDAWTVEKHWTEQIGKPFKVWDDAQNFYGQIVGHPLVVTVVKA